MTRRHHAPRRRAPLGDNRWHFLPRDALDALATIF
jgi:hypothetical protein